MSRRRLLILTEMDPWSASTRYRALQYVPRLRPLFARVDVSLPGDSLERVPGRMGQLRYFGAHAARYVARGYDVRASVRDADVAFIQRGLYPVGPGMVAAAISRFEGRLVLDLDDAVFSLKPSLVGRGAMARWLYGPQQARALVRRADAIVVSTPELGNALPPGVVAPTVIPTVPDPSRYPLAEQHEDRPVVVGWAGTVGNIRYLDPLRPVFESLNKDSTAGLEVVSTHRWSGPSTFHRWTLDEEASLFRRFSIGIMPLPDTDYTRAKAGFKLLQYMAAGLPVVASPIGVNRELIEHSHAGYLASSAGEWEEALRDLASDAALRRRLGGNGRAFVQEYADLERHTKTLAELLLK